MSELVSDNCLCNGHHVLTSVAENAGDAEEDASTVGSCQGSVSCRSQRHDKTLVIDVIV